MSSAHPPKGSHSQELPTSTHHAPLRPKGAAPMQGKRAEVEKPWQRRQRRREASAAGEPWQLVESKSFPGKFFFFNKETRQKRWVDSGPKLPKSVNDGRAAPSKLSVLRRDHPTGSQHAPRQEGQVQGSNCSVGASSSRSCIWAGTSRPDAESAQSAAEGGEEVAKMSPSLQQAAADGRDWRELEPFDPALEEPGPDWRELEPFDPALDDEREEDDHGSSEELDTKASSQGMSPSIDRKSVV
eukprot:TRINITY_DN101165_c0_g1_i1.p1 TRINITY_DN101165_c0_g1~~TRINITY_DN101165_c0_g1_i1.p1  ORF type:complete len:242 (+),score=51.16 TRINITY_DN101165_c0_g1_i1:56-781(+)